MRARKPTQKREARRTLHYTRRSVQLAFLAAFLLLAWAASYPPSRYLRENFFLRVDPLGALSAFMRASALLPLWPAMALLLLTFLSGRFFCGWICPLGTVLEMIPSPLRLKKRRMEGIRPRGVDGAVLLPGARRPRVKYLLLLALLVLLPFGVNLLWLFDPLVIAHRSAVQVFTGSLPLLFLGLLVLALAAGPRFWCQEVCPLGALLSAAGWAGRGLREDKALLSLVKDEAACVHCGRCALACPFWITEVADTGRSGRLLAFDCALCGECLEACPADGALSLVSLGRRIAVSTGPCKPSESGGRRRDDPTCQWEGMSPSFEGAGDGEQTRTKGPGRGG